MEEVESFGGGATNHQAQKENTMKGGRRQANTAAIRTRSLQQSNTQSHKLMATAGSPFRRLNDEEVFITRETEKQKRKEAKERARNLKIWDKKTSTSRQPLRRVKDADIAPAQMEDNIYNFNSVQRGAISSAMHIAKSRVSFSRGEQQMRPQNIKEFVDQKKEMFLVELSFNTVKKEIEELDHKQSRKKTAIETSNAQLLRDNAKLMKFIEADSVETSKKENLAKKALLDCQGLQMENKELDNKINIIKSDISKKKDELNALDEHKKFLLALSVLQNASWVANQEREKKKKRDEIKRRWIEEHKRDTRDDNIIFREDDDLFSVDAYFKGAGGSSVADASEKAGPGVSVPPSMKSRKNNAMQFQQLKRENMNDKDWDLKFEMLFQEDLIHLDPKFFDEDLCFNDPNDLNQIFSELEEQNLYLIHQSQDLEHSLEQQNQEYARLKEQLGREAEQHKKGKEELIDQIEESRKNLQDLKKKNQLTTIQASHDSGKDKKDAAAAEMEINIEDILNDLRRDICRVYAKTKNIEMDLQAKQTIDILTEIEVELEDKMKYIHYIEQTNEPEVIKEEKERKQQYKSKIRQENQEKEAEMLKKKNDELRSRMDRVYEKVGRQIMPRSQKKSVKREVRVVQVDQETLDRQRYLGEIADSNNLPGQIGTNSTAGQISGYQTENQQVNQSAMLMGSSQAQSSQQSKKSSSKQRQQVQGAPITNTAGTTLTSFQGQQYNGSATINSNQQHNLTGKIPQLNLLQQQQLKVLPTHSSLSMNPDHQLSASQKKRISLKKLEEDYCKTIEQLGSPNSSTLNLENMKKTQSLHYMRGAASGSGANSPQQVKSRTSIGKYNNNPGALANLAMQNGNQYQQFQQRQIISKSQMGGPVATNGVPGRSRSKTTNRKKRNLYTSMGNYYQSQQPAAQQQVNVGANHSASRVTKRVHQQNFLENLEQTNMVMGGNIAAAQQFLVQDEQLIKKRNKSSTKTYANKELLENNNNNSEICYSSHLTKKNPNIFDVSQFSSNQNSIAKNFENSFQFSAGAFLPPNSGKHHNTSLSAAHKPGARPASSHKSALFAAAAAVSSSIGLSKSGKKKTQTLRKSVNHPVVQHPMVNNLMNTSANYGHHLQQNAYDFLSNASLFINSGKGQQRRPNKGGHTSVIDSRCSDNHSVQATALGFAKSQVASNTAFGNNTSHTTICSNRKSGNEIVSGKKNSLQQQNYLNFAVNGGNHTSDMLTAGEISSDRQTLKMNDFLKQIEAYSNDKLDKFMPSMNQQVQQTPNGTVSLSQTAKVAEQVKNVIDREMAVLAALRTTSSKQRYQNDESREDEDEDQQQQLLPDYEHLLNVISDSFNSMISTFYQNPQASIIGVGLSRVKDSYEEIINSIVENLTFQIDTLNGEIEMLRGDNEQLHERNNQITEIQKEQAINFARQKEELAKELTRLYDENKVLKKDQKDRDNQLFESKKLIDKLTASQKQLLNTNSRPLMNESSQLNKSSIINGKLSATSVPPLDLGRLKQQQTQQIQQQPLLSSDSLQTLDKAIMNDHPSQSSVMNTVPQNLEGSRMLEELYQQPFNANQSDISYRENSLDCAGDNEAIFLSNNQNGFLNQSGRLSQIAQDKSPAMKPFIPPLNLNGIQNRQQAARQVQKPLQQQQQQQQQQQNNGKQQPKFKLDLNQVSQTQAQAQAQAKVEQDFQEQQVKQAPIKAPGGLGLNLANLKQQKGIIDFQDEFTAKADEFSQSWRDAMKREKRF